MTRLVLSNTSYPDGYPVANLNRPVRFVMPPSKASSADATDGAAAQQREVCQFWVRFLASDSCRISAAIRPSRSVLIAVLSPTSSAATAGPGNERLSERRLRRSPVPEAAWGADHIRARRDRRLRRRPERAVGLLRPGNRRAVQPGRAGLLRPNAGAGGQRHTRCTHPGVSGPDGPTPRTRGGVSVCRVRRQRRRTAPLGDGRAVAQPRRLGAEVPTPLRRMRVGRGQPNVHRTGLRVERADVVPLSALDGASAPSERSVISVMRCPARPPFAGWLTSEPLTPYL